MSNFCCSCKRDCSGTAIVVSIIIGIITAFLRYSGIITLTPAFLWVIFGIAVVYLALAFLKSPITRKSHCICSNLPVFLAGILGTILTSLILLAITFEATSLIGAIIAGAALFFFSLIITTTACIIECEADCNN